MEIKDVITDAAAIVILLAVAAQSYNMIAVSEEMKVAFGAAISYLFIKHSPNSV